jgi:pimeloyl-ACP methyl ester carboxylesterase
MVDLIELEASDLVFTTRKAGDSGEPVVFLHGFPETSAMWSGLMDDLATRGYQSIAPDQRGYSPGARPEGIEPYGHEYIGGDVLNIATAAGFDRFHLVAHDWGACAGWAAIDLDKDKRIASYTAISIPHYRGFAEAIPDDPDGELYRLYLKLFNDDHEGTVREWSENDFEVLQERWVLSSETERQQYYEVFSQPGMLAAAFAWYPATRSHARGIDGTSLEFGPVTTPTMLIWGNQDPYVRRLSVTRGEKYMKGPFEYVELDHSHWLIQEVPEIIHDLVLRQLQTYPLLSVNV